MSNKRRDLLKSRGGALPPAERDAADDSGRKETRHAPVETASPRKGAKLRVLRWSRFVQGDIDQYMKNVQAVYRQVYGPSKCASTARAGKDVAPEGGGRGQHRRRPGHHSRHVRPTANLYPEKLVDGPPTCATTWAKKVPAAGNPEPCELYLKPDGKTPGIGVPLGANPAA